MRAGDVLPDTPPPGYDRAMGLLADLLEGIDSPNAFVPSSKHTGLCRVCGDFRALTFEHIPPRAAGNSRPARAFWSLQMATSDEPLAFPTRGWKPSQRGVGGYVLCAVCNNLVGTRYVPEYVHFANTLTDRVCVLLESSGHLPGILELQLGDWALGDVARAGLVTLMDVAVHDRLLARHPDLTAVVQHPGTPLPPSLRLGLTLVLGSQARLSAPICTTNPEGCVAFSEAALAPFAWTLGFIEDGLGPLDRTSDVSDWLLYGQAERPAEATLELPIGFLASPNPGDYRPAPEIEADMPSSD